jgi:hypothetical protein
MEMMISSSYMVRGRCRLAQLTPEYQDKEPLNECGILPVPARGIPGVVFLDNLTVDPGYHIPEDDGVET